jgi:hypothetical protein
MTLVKDFVEGFCKRAKAPPPAPRADGIYILHFDGKYTVEVRAHGDDHVMLVSGLPPLKPGTQREEQLTQLMRINLALSDRKRATLALETGGDTPLLYDMLARDAADMASGFRAVTGFVNEVAAFHAALERGHHIY